MSKKILDEVKRIQSLSTLIYSKNDIDIAINSIAKKMNLELYNQNPLFLCVMSGALIFTGNLLTKIEFYSEIDYIHVSRYRGEINAKDLHWFAEPSTSLKGRNIIILDDILDSGLTLTGIINYCAMKGAKSIYTAVLIDKNCNREVGGLKSADYFGLKSENKFLIGYGLDFKGYLRNLPDIYEVNC